MSGDSPNSVPDPTMSEADVRELAALSRLSPSEAQIEGLRRDLGAVLGHAECLMSVDLDDVEPMARPVDEVNRLDDDEPGATLDRAALERMAPSFEDGFVRVPRVLGDGGGA